MRRAIIVVGIPGVVLTWWRVDRTLAAARTGLVARLQTVFVYAVWVSIMVMAVYD